MVIPDTPLSGIEPGTPLRATKILARESQGSNFNAIHNYGDLNTLVWKEPQKPYYTTISAPDLVLEEKSNIVQNRYSANAIYEWNIDGQSEYYILSVLQQMTMVSNAYKTQTRLSDPAIAHMLIAGFTGQLKGWWDNYLSPFQQNEILTSVKTDESESSDSETDYSSASKESLQADELDWSSDGKSINVLTRDQEFLIGIADQIQNPLLRKQYLEKLQQGTLEGEIKTPNYNLSEILKRHDKKRAHKTSFDAQKEIDNLRSELVCLKLEQQQHSTIIGRLEELFAEAGSSGQVLMKHDKNPEETLALTKDDQQKALTMIGDLSPNRWNMDLPWFDQVDKGSSSRNKPHKHQDLPPKKRSCIKSSLTAWRPDSRQQLILDDLWSSIKNPQKGIGVPINSIDKSGCGSPHRKPD
ncbi:hypothetical protein CRG98_024741 [Punica granatum]|uniref:DUF7746 domain-containing protein n=1 Tax=Punica granatum TaxID=22663 RepID=A0A2I0JF51_PUNGR|nr:hypothetical protein CRG98_024741 [Punica granatum]